jgi:hypothetical protein
LNKRVTDVLRLFLFKPVSRSINKMSTVRVRAGGILQSFIHLVRHAPRLQRRCFLLRRQRFQQ